MARYPKDPNDPYPEPAAIAPGQPWEDHDHLFDCLDAEDCFMCGGSGVLDGECECSAFEDTCMCLHPTPRACPECIERDRDLIKAKLAMAEPTVTQDELKAELAEKPEK